MLHIRRRRKHPSRQSCVLLKRQKSCRDTVHVVVPTSHVPRVEYIRGGGMGGIWQVRSGEVRGEVQGEVHVVSGGSAEEGVAPVSVFARVLWAEKVGVSTTTAKKKKRTHRCSLRTLAGRALGAPLVAAVAVGGRGEVAATA